MLKRLSTLAFALLTCVSINAATAAPPIGKTTGNYLNVGETQLAHGGTSKAGIGMSFIGNGKRVAADSLHRKLAGQPDAQGITRFQLGNPSAPLSHANMGRWAIGAVKTATGNPAYQEVYFGAWEGKDAGAVRKEAFFVGVDPTNINQDSLKGKQLKYSLVGVDSIANSKVYTGSLTANINAGGTGGQVNGSLSNTANSHVFNQANLTQNGSFAGKTTAKHEVAGQLYGAGAEAVAGYIKNASNPVGFGGRRTN